VDAVKPRSPAATMHIRPHEREPDVKPQYVDLGSTLTKKKCTIGRRETLDMVPI
jgi:hypothetical protein